MKIYLAGNAGSEAREKRWQSNCRARLLTYWSILNDEFAVPYAFNLIRDTKQKTKNGAKEN